MATDKVGESLDHYQLDEGDVVLIDRGYNPPKTLVPFLDRGGDGVLRYNAHGMNVYEAHSAEGMAGNERSISERPRQWQLQSLPAPIHSLIEKCRLVGVSHV